MAHTATAPLQIGTVSLTVHDLDKVSAYYQDTIGLHLLSSEAGIARLGVGSDVLLELVEDRGATLRNPHDAGLFHTAFLLPKRADLGAWVQFAATTRKPVVGASDHAVSEALYLTDPEGNGIEIYTDRPRNEWPSQNGKIAMTTEHLDIEDLVASATGPWAGFPEGSTVGHVHLQVGAVAPASAFYGQGLGMDSTADYPGAGFFAWGGYHHHIAANIWNSRNAGPRPERTTGLRNVGIVADSAATLAAVRDGLVKAGIEIRDDASGLGIADPWGNTLTIATREI